LPHPINSASHRAIRPLLFAFSTITIFTFGGAYAAMFVWASLVGASRVIIGVHYPGDIVAGAVMGSGIAVATASMLNIW
jgi:undecaprenyl-diphosphatase